MIHCLPVTRYTIHCLPVTRYMIHCLTVTHTEQGQNVERHALQGTTQMASVWVQQQCAFAVRHAAQVRTVYMHVC